MQQTIKKHTVKIQIATIVSIILFIVATTWWIAIEKSRLEEQLARSVDEIEELSEDLEVMKKDIKLNANNNNEIRIELASIEARLINIESILIDLKKKIEEI